MKINTDKVDDAVLALLYLTLHEDRGRGKASIGTLNRLHEKGFISNPVGKAKSADLTARSLQEWERLLPEALRHARALGWLSCRFSVLSAPMVPTEHLVDENQT